MAENVIDMTNNSNIYTIIVLWKVIILSPQPKHPIPGVYIVARLKPLDNLNDILYIYIYGASK